MSQNRLEDDRELSAVIRAASLGSLAHLTTVVERFTPLLIMQAEYRIGAPLRRFVDPTDLVNDVWLVALRRLPEYRPEPGSTSAGLMRFLGTVLLRQVRDLYDKHIAGKPSAIALPDRGVDGGSERGAALELSAETTGVVSRAVRAERHDSVRSAIASLDPTDRAVVVLRAIEEQPVRVVAAVTGLAPNTVTVRLRRALEKLRQTLPASIVDHLVGPDSDELG